MLYSKRRCGKCKKIKPISEFYKRRVGNWEGWQGYCKSCDKKVALAFMLSPKGKVHQRRFCQSPAGFEYRGRQYKRKMVLYPEKLKANTAVNNAIRTGVLVKPKACQGCGVKGPVEGHHEDYSKLLMVEWLCMKCHRAVNNV